MNKMGEIEIIKFIKQKSDFFIKKVPKKLQHLHKAMMGVVPHHDTCNTMNEH